MKKRNKGFILIETLIVSTFVISTLVYLYVQFASLKKSYDVSFRYDTINGLYNAREFDKFINNNYGYSDFFIDIEKDNNNYIELVNNSTYNLLYFSNNNDYINKLIKNLNIKTVLLSSSNLKIKDALKENNPYSNNLYLYIKNINTKNLDDSYILITEFNDNTFSYVKIKKNVGDTNE